MNKKALIAAAVCLLAGIAAVIYFACAPKTATADFFAMDTYMNFKVTGKNADAVISEAKAETERLDKEILSRQSAGSEVDTLNENHGGILSERLKEYLESLLGVYEKSGGGYDFTLGAVSDLWGFGKNPAVPDENELKNALKLTGADKLRLNDRNIAIPQGAVLDFGSAGKGIVLDEVKGILDNSDVREAVISAGGSILVYGKREFTVGIKDPEGGNGYVAVLTVPQTCVSTSGSYERYFESEGKRYHHILDPETGCPADNSLISVTVISQSGILSDALSTACFVCGIEDGMRLAEEYGCEAVFIDNNHRIYASAGIKDSIEITGGAYSFADEE